MMVYEENSHSRTQLLQYMERFLIVFNDLLPNTGTKLWYV